MIRTELRQNVKVRLALGTVLNHHRYMYKVGFKTGLSWYQLTYMYIYWQLKELIKIEIRGVIQFDLVWFRKKLKLNQINSVYYFLNQTKPNQIRN